MGEPTELPPSDGSPIRVIGRVKWFSHEKGFGFICSTEIEGDILLHRSVVQTRATTATNSRRW